MRYKIFILIIAILSCQTVKSQKRVNVVGFAKNAKAAAIVELDSGGFYYIDKLPFWDKKYYGKRVKVTGVEGIIKEKKTPKNRTIQKVMGDMIIIKHAKWSLVKE